MGLIAFITYFSELGWSEAELHQVRNHLWQGEAARRIWWDRTARSSLSEGGDFPRSARPILGEPSTQLIQPGRSNICDRCGLTTLTDAFDFAAADDEKARAIGASADLACAARRVGDRARQAMVPSGSRSPGGDERGARCIERSRHRRRKNRS
jgi:hypothetical protein